jgi:outer membrane protein OmpA-like peptidoglycan-associated protein
MTRFGSGHTLFTLLGLGTADLALLNLWAIPAVFSSPTVAPLEQAAPREVPAESAPADGAKRGPTAPLVVKREPEPRETSHSAAEQPARTGALAATPKPERAPSLPVASEPAPSPPSAAEVAPASPETIILFGRGTWWLGPRARERLQSSLEQVGQSYTIVVSGHADRSGSRDINLRISEQRAEAVRDELVRAGFDPKRIKTRWYGEDRPSATGHDRRVEIALRGEP